MSVILTGDNHDDIVSFAETKRYSETIADCYESGVSGWVSDCDRVVIVHPDDLDKIPSGGYRIITVKFTSD